MYVCMYVSPPKMDMGEFLDPTRPT